MLRYIDSSINDDGDERLTVDGRDLYEAMVDQVEKDLGEVAGLRPLPINRMRKQAGREGNQFYTRGEYGPPQRNNRGEVYRNSDGTPQRSRVRNTFDPQNRGSSFGYYEKGDGRMPDDMKQRLIERHQKANDAINNWDPIEASAQEDYNRLKGGRRGPVMGPLDAIELIQPIAPLDKPMYEAFPGV
jgi:hypothetical protein